MAADRRVRRQGALRSNRRVFSANVMALDAVDKMKYWLDRGFSGHAAVHDRQHDAGSGGSTTRAAVRRRSAPAGIPVGMQTAPSGFPQPRGLMERLPQVTIVLDHPARPAIADGPSHAAAAASAPAERNPPGTTVTPRHVAAAGRGRAAQTLHPSLATRCARDSARRPSAIPSGSTMLDASQ